VVGLLGALLGLAGCAEPYSGSALAGVLVSEAWLDVDAVGAVSMVAGGVGGTGLLSVVGDDGALYEQPVNLQGNVAGLIVDLNLALPFDTVALELPPEEVTGDQLFGRYSGSYKSLVAPIGVQSYHLRNDADVEMDRAMLALGVGLTVAWAWVSLLPDGEEVASGDGQSPDTGDTGALGR
jgi:hypothetical protein